jgi:tetratricopeptide (TPR) repeat protein
MGGSRSRASGSKVSRRVAFGLITAGTAAAAAWFEWPSLQQILHPLPEQRFVALMAWPSNTDSQYRPLLNGILDVIATQLIRAESATKHLMLIRPADVAGPTVRDLRDVTHTLGANLVLAAWLKAARDRLVLALSVIDASAGRTLRKQEIAVPPGQANLLPDHAWRVAASLLQLGSPQSAPSRDELGAVSAAGYQAFLAAEELRRQPNESRLDDAIAKYEEALEADPNFALAYAQLAFVYVRKYFKTREPAALRLAERNSARALEIDPNSPKAIFSQALVSLYSGKTEQAMQAFQKLDSIDPGNPEILLYQAGAFSDLGKLPEEEQIYRRIIKQRPNFWPAYNDLGRLLYSQGRISDAAQAFEEAAAVAPRVALPVANAGSMFVLLGRRNDAIQAFQKSLTLAPNELAFINLGNFAFEDKNYAKALELYGKARDLNPKSDETWRSIADCYQVLGNPRMVTENYAQAAAAVNERLALNPRRARDWMTLAFYEAKAGRSRQAETAIQKAEELGAGSVEEQFLKAQALAVLGRKEEAVHLVLQCLDRGLSAVEVQYALDLRYVLADARYRRRAGAAPSQSGKAGS